MVVGWWVGGGGGGGGGGGVVENKDKFWKRPLSLNSEVI